MIGRVARLRLADANVEEATIRALAAQALPLVEGVDGFVGGYFMQDTEGGALLITLWRDAASHIAAVPQMLAAMDAVRASGAEVVGPIEEYSSVLFADATGVRPAVR